MLMVSTVVHGMCLLLAVLQSVNGCASYECASYECASYECVLGMNVLQMYVLGMNASYKVQQNEPFKYKIEYVRLYGVTWHFYFALHLFSMAVGAPGETQEIQN